MIFDPIDGLNAVLGFAISLGAIATVVLLIWLGKWLFDEKKNKFLAFLVWFFVLFGLIFVVGGFFSNRG